MEPFDDVDPSKIQGDQEAAEKRARLQQFIGAATNSLGNQHSFGEFFLGHMAPENRDRLGDQYAKAERDKVARLQSTLDQYREHKLKEQDTERDRAYESGEKERFLKLQDQLQAARDRQRYGQEVGLVDRKTQAEMDKAKFERAAGGTYKQNQYQAANFGNRLEQAEKVFGALNEKGFDPTSDAVRSQHGWWMPDRFKQEDVKKQDQAQDNFLAAVLRKESGAAIGKEERTEGARQYFPTHGDTPDVLAQKAVNRAAARAAFKAEAGGAWDEVAGELRPLEAGINPGMFAKTQHQGGGMISEANATQDDQRNLDEVKSEARRRRIAELEAKQSKR